MSDIPTFEDETQAIIASWRARRERHPKAYTIDSQVIIRSRIVGVLAVCPALKTGEIALTLGVTWQQVSTALRLLEAVGMVCAVTRASTVRRQMRWCLMSDYRLFEAECGPAKRLKKPERRRQWTPTKRVVITSDTLDDVFGDYVETDSIEETDDDRG